MSRKSDPADQAVAYFAQAVAYFATEPLDLARATLNRCLAVVKAREKANVQRAPRKARAVQDAPSERTAER